MSSGQKEMLQKGFKAGLFGSSFPPQNKKKRVIRYS